jgi:hypothetical protein
MFLIGEVELVPRDAVSVNTSGQCEAKMASLPPRSTPWDGPMHFSEELNVGDDHLRSFPPT